jgi:DNA-binding MarR family transcriptional regulator
MLTFLARLVRASNLLSHHLDDRITELGIGTQEYLVLRSAILNPDASTAMIRRSLGLRDAAFSDVVRRSVHRGYAREVSFPHDRRTRRIELTLPGGLAVRIAGSIHLDLEAVVGTGPWRVDALDRLELIGRRLATIPVAERYRDGLPVDTA